MDDVLNLALNAKDKVDKQQEFKPDPVETAAIFVNQAHKSFKELAYALADRKKHSVSRVLEAMIFEPLEEVKLQGKEEQELFDICQQVMYNKGIVMNYALEQLEKKKGETNDSEKNK